ncbi:UNVERIFIED_CONTAM: hypothetical protein FKN15_018277 [Acipenser sinensis]
MGNKWWHTSAGPRTKLRDGMARQELFAMVATVRHFCHYICRLLHHSHGLRCTTVVADVPWQVAGNRSLSRRSTRSEERAQHQPEMEGWAATIT